MGADLTIAYLYYRDVDYMRKHAETWSKPNYFTAEVKRRVVFLVIDDGSPEPDDAATLFNSMACSSVRTVVVRVTEDIAWNIGGARNLIFTVAPTELVFSVDADQILPPDLVEWALLGRKYRATLDNCNIVRGFPRKLQNGRKFRVHPGVMLASKSSYWRVGGCEEADALFLDTLFEELLGAAGSPHFITAASGDEDFVGAYGHTDVHFNFRVTYNTRGCNIVAADSAPPMICIDDPLKKTNFFKRETDHNKAIFHAKTSKQKPWSTDYLRFSWAVTYDSALRNPCS